MNEYWKKRFEELENQQYQKGIEYYKDLQEQFRQAQNNITLDIEHWYQRIADNNGISLVAAKKLLKKDELKEFHWNVEQYIKAGKENAVSGQWMKQLENASAKWHISYLESMKLQIQQHCELLSAQYNQGLTGFLHNAYSDDYYRTAFEIQKGIGVGTNLVRLNTDRIDTVINIPWAMDGKNFSSRIWENKQKLVNNLHRELSQCLITGESPQKAVERLSKIMGVSESQAKRLVMTELAAVNAKSKLDSYKNIGIEEYVIIATLDSRTSEICQDMDGKHFPIADYVVGVTANPFHPNCRTTTAPYIVNETEYEIKRVARNENNEIYHVPANMTYKDWQKAFIDGDKSGLKIIKSNDTINYMDITKKWAKKNKKGTIIEKLSYIVDGVTYVVDGKHVILDPSNTERSIAVLFSEKYGKDVELVPKVNYPAGVQTPDYLIDGERYDLKSPTGSSKNLLYNLVAKKKKQASNFIFDITDCPLSDDDIERQVKELYFSRHTRFIDKIVILKNKEVIKVYERQ